jgi:hypothetical protein
VFDVVCATNPGPDAVTSACPVPPVRVKLTGKVPFFDGELNWIPPGEKLSDPVLDRSALQLRLVTPFGKFHDTVNVPEHVVVPVSVIAMLAPRPFGGGFVAEAEVTPNARTTTTTLRAVTKRRMIILPSLAALLGVASLSNGLLIGKATPSEDRQA